MKKIRLKTSRTKAIIPPLHFLAGFLPFHTAILYNFASSNTVTHINFY